MAAFENQPEYEERRAKLWPFWIGAFSTLMAPPSVMLLTGDYKAAGVTAVCCLVFTLLTRMEEVAELSLGPLKAKMREQVREAAATVLQLKAVAASTVAANLTTLMSGNFMDGTSLQARLELYDRLMESLQNVGFTEEELQTLTVDWRKGIGVLYHRAIRSALLNRRDARDLGAETTPERTRIANEWQGLCLFERWEVPPPAEMRQFLHERGVRDPAVENWIDDYAHYLATGEIPRRDVFARQ